MNATHRDTTRFQGNSSRRVVKCGQLLNWLQDVVLLSCGGDRTSSIAGDATCMWAKLRCSRQNGGLVSLLDFGKPVKVELGLYMYAVSHSECCLNCSGNILEISQSSSTSSTIRWWKYHCSSCLLKHGRIYHLLPIILLKRSFSSTSYMDEDSPPNSARCCLILALLVEIQMKVKIFLGSPLKTVIICMGVDTSGHTAN